MWQRYPRERLLLCIVAISALGVINLPNVQDITRLALSRSIAERGSVDIDPYHRLTTDRAFYNGHWYSDKAPGLSLIALPTVEALRGIDAVTGRSHLPVWKLVGHIWLIRVLTSGIGLLAAAFLLGRVRIAAASLVQIRRAPVHEGPATRILRDRDPDPAWGPPALPRRQGPARRLAGRRRCGGRPRAALAPWHTRRSRRLHRGDAPLHLREHGLLRAVRRYVTGTPVLRADLAVPGARAGGGVPPLARPDGDPRDLVGVGDDVRRPHVGVARQAVLPVHPEHDLGPGPGDQDARRHLHPHRSRRLGGRLRRVRACTS